MLRRISTHLSPLFQSPFYQASHCSRIMEVFSTDATSSLQGGACSKEKQRFIAFVLGGPGSGKGTQCAKIVEAYGLTHLSAGDLLRNEISSKSEHGSMILDIIKVGKIVPSEVTVKLIQKAISSTDSHKFLIDGFPRTEENRLAYEQIIGEDPNLVLFFDCPEEVMLDRILHRNEGRVDDNDETVKTRLKVFKELSLPVIHHYSKKGILHTINAVGTEDEIFNKASGCHDGKYLLIILDGSSFSRRVTYTYTRVQDAELDVFGPTPDFPYGVCGSLLAEIVLHYYSLMKQMKDYSM